MKVGIITILSLLPFVMEAQVVVKPNLNTVVGDTTRFSLFDDGKLSIDAYNKQFGLTLKNIVTDVPSGNRYIYGIYNIQNTSTLPYQEQSPSNPWVRVALQNEMITRFGQFINSMYNYVTEKPNTTAGVSFSQTTGILNKMDTIGNQLNGVYNSVRVPNSGDIKLFRNYIDQRQQVNTYGVVQGLYNDFEMSGNKSNYGVYNVMKSNDNYAPANTYDYEAVGVKNIFKKSDATIATTLNGFLQKTIGVFNDMAIYGGNASNGYGIFNLMKITQTSPSNVYGIRTELLPDAGVNTTLGSFLPGNLYGIYSTVDSTLINRPNAYAAVFSGKVLVNGTLLQTSDISLKENIADYKDALTIIKKLTPKTYNIKSEKDDPKRKLHAGLLAQDVELVTPDLVSTFNQPGKIRIKEENIEVIKFEIEKDNNGNPVVKKVKTTEKKETKTEDPPTELKVVNYMELIPILMQAIKEQQATIEQLQKDIDKIKLKIGN